MTQFVTYVTGSPTPIDPAPSDFSTTTRCAFLPQAATDAAFASLKGSALVAGDHYYNTTSNLVRFYDGSSWSYVMPKIIPAAVTESVTVSTGDELKDVLDSYAGFALLGTVTINCAAGTYNCFDLGKWSGPRRIKVVGDTRTYAGRAFTNYGTQTIALASSTYTITDSGGNPDFNADGWGSGDKAFVYQEDNSSVTECTIQSTSSNTITFTASPPSTTGSTMMILAPNRIIAPTTATDYDWMTNSNIEFIGFHFEQSGTPSYINIATENNDGSDNVALSSARILFNNCFLDHVSIKQYSGAVIFNESSILDNTKFLFYLYGGNTLLNKCGFLGHTAVQASELSKVRATECCFGYFGNNETVGVFNFSGNSRGYLDSCLMSHNNNSGSGFISGIFVTESSKVVVKNSSISDTSPSFYGEIQYGIYVKDCGHIYCSSVTMSAATSAIYGFYAINGGKITTTGETVTNFGTDYTPATSGTIGNNGSLCNRY